MCALRYAILPRRAGRLPAAANQSEPAVLSAVAFVKGPPPIRGAVRRLSLDAACFELPGGGSVASFRRLVEGQKRV